MKKIIIALIATLGFASYSFAATIGESGTTLGTATFKPSTRVKIGVKANATTYAALSKHYQGTKIYGAVASDQTIWVKDGTTGTDVGEPTDSGNIGDGFSSL